MARRSDIIGFSFVERRKAPHVEVVTKPPRRSLPGVTIATLHTPENSKEEFEFCVKVHVSRADGTERSEVHSSGWIDGKASWDKVFQRGLWTIKGGALRGTTTDNDSDK